MHPLSADMRYVPMPKLQKDNSFEMTERIDLYEKGLGFFAAIHENCLGKFQQLCAQHPTVFHYDYPSGKNVAHTLLTLGKRTFIQVAVKEAPNSKEKFQIEFINLLFTKTFHQDAGALYQELFSPLAFMEMVFKHPLVKYELFKNCFFELDTLRTDHLKSVVDVIHSQGTTNEELFSVYPYETYREYCGDFERAFGFTASSYAAFLGIPSSPCLIS